MPIIALWKAAEPPPSASIRCGAPGASEEYRTWASPTRSSDLSESGTLGGVPDTKLPLAKTTTSARKLTDYMKLNVRATIEPCDKYSEPVTSNMAYGWGFRIPQ